MRRKNLFWIVVLVMMMFVFFLEYYLIVTYIESVFKFTKKEVLDSTLSIERNIFIKNIIRKGVFALLQFVGCVICLNIGFLFFNFKIKIREILIVVLQSFIAIIIIQLIIIGIVKFSNLTMTMGSIESIENKTYILNFLKIVNVPKYLILPFRTFNLTHLIFILTLTYGIKTLIKGSYIKSFIFTMKTYGIGVFLWFIFSVFMEMNFN